MKKTKIDLEKDTIKLLEITKKSVMRYSNERKKLFNYYNEENTDLAEWEKYIFQVSEKVNNDKEFKL